MVPREGEKTEKIIASVHEGRVVRDPIGGSANEYRAARDQIERLVMNLIVDLRRQSNALKPVNRK